ncbi:NAD(P)/FAD-dependent oxidoreductase [Mycobacterium aquaticum]|uniref:Pyridine nucleotide-disulfide oxidoreductase n=1 Tax=Mycobacterium aquaticum TaxID=1927124 RepID=A0A1X0A892_9MYCO|nr:FAD-dependent oxidoreductase [Mycobacterium aquaticum]ORA26280.1 pyridine nucleotide-disulfide oxidoreductase [Mycobacterium aquaticum]
MSEQFDVLIVGGGHGGTAAAMALRQYGFDGSVGIVNAESTLPYQRPPLSKSFLAGEVGLDRILIRPESFWAENRITLIQGTRVDAVQPAAKVAITDTGESIGYGQLIWAAGSSPRWLDPARDRKLSGVHVVRDVSDTQRLRTDVLNGSRAVIVGGGYVGLEVAAVLRKLGKPVTVLEAADRVLARVSAEPISQFYEAQHREHGVEIQVGRQVADLEARNGHVNAVHLATGEELPCDVVVIGIGAMPTTAPLIAAGAAAGNGLLVDALCRTSLPGIFAIGDSVAAPNRYAGGATVRLESLQNAADQGVIVARHIAGQPQGDPPVPTFWSDQYDLKLKTVGLNTGYDEVVVRGTPASKSFSVVYLRDGRVTAIDAVNAMKDFAQGKALVRSGADIAPALLADPSRPISDLLAQIAR